MLQQLPQAEKPHIQVKIATWQLGAALLILVIGIGLGVVGCFLFLQPHVPRSTANSSSPIVVIKPSPTPTPITPVTAVKPPPTIYSVKSGDNLSAIAEQFCGKGTSWQVMVKANPQLKGREDYIDVGEVFKVPCRKEEG